MTHKLEPLKPVRFHSQEGQRILVQHKINLDFRTIGLDPTHGINLILEKPLPDPCTVAFDSKPESENGGKPMICSGPLADVARILEANGLDEAAQILRKFSK